MQTEIRSRSASSTRTTPHAVGENLVSIVVVADGDPLEAAAALSANHHAFLEAFEFCEILFVVCAITHDDLEALKERLADVANVRLVVLNLAADFDDLLAEGLALAIGDIVVAVGAGAIGPDDAIRLVEAATERRLDVVRALRPPEKGLRARIGRAATRRILSALVGRRIEPLQCRALCVSRRALATLLTDRTALRTFRVVEMGDMFEEGRLVVGSAGGRARGGLLRRARLVAELAALRSPQIAAALAVVLAACSGLGAAYGLYAVAVFLLKDDVAEGWLSISLLMSFISATSFATLAVLSLGMAQLLRASQPSAGHGMVQEFSNADLFSRTRRLNVEIAHDD